MALEEAIITWIHLTSAAIWVGGSLFIGAVLAPILKNMSYSMEERLEITRADAESTKSLYFIIF